MGKMKERSYILGDIQQMVSDWTQFVDKDDIVGNMVLSYILANEDDICDLILEKMKGTLYKG